MGDHANALVGPLLVNLITGPSPLPPCLPLGTKSVSLLPSPSSCSRHGHSLSNRLGLRLDQEAVIVVAHVPLAVKELGLKSSEQGVLLPIPLLVQLNQGVLFAPDSGEFAPTNPRLGHSTENQENF